MNEAAGSNPLRAQTEALNTMRNEFTKAAQKDIQR